MFDLYLITDPDAPGGVVHTVSAALQGVAPGRVAVQLRDKRMPAQQLRELARELRAITTRAGALLLLNRHVELARELNADGVQLPAIGPQPASVRALLGPHCLIGASCHDATELTRSCTQGADFLTLSPVFTVPGKGKALGIERFGELARACSLPSFALGGVDATHVPQLMAAGAHGLAVIRAVFAASDPSRAVAQCLAAIDRARASDALR